MAEISVREQKPLWCPLCLASSPFSSSPTRGRQLDPRREPLLKIRDRSDPAARVNAANDRFFRLPVSLQDGLVALELKQVRESNRRQYTPCPRRHCRGSIELPADEFRLLPDEGISDLEPEDEQDAEFGFASSSERKEVKMQMLKGRDDRDHGTSSAFSQSTFCEDCCSGSSVLFTYACDPFLCKYVSVKLPDLGVYAKLHDPEKNAEVVQALMEQLEEAAANVKMLLVWGLVQQVEAVPLSQGLLELLQERMQTPLRYN
eukprot:g17372.t1